MGSTFSISTGDIDGDGKVDLVVANAFESSVSVLLGRGDGTFEPPFNAFVGGLSESNPQSVAVSDFNGDGKRDIVTANGSSGGVSILLGRLCNEPPVARGKNVSTSAGPDCPAAVSLDDGSFDPDVGDTLTITQDPPGPYPLGETIVRLTVTDNHGASAVCNNIVTVVDTTPPSLACPANISVTLLGGVGGVSWFMESPLGLTTVHWDHKPRPPGARRKAPINRTHSRRFARFGEARRSRSVWSACVFSAAFPKQAPSEPFSSTSRSAH